MNTGQRSPKTSRKITGPAAARARMFCLIKKLTMDEEAYHAVAAQCRADGLPTTKEMSAAELSTMNSVLQRELNKRQKAERGKQQEVRDKRRNQHKRQDGPEGDYASEQARHFLKSQAVILWGEDEWIAELHSLIKKMTGYDYFWDMLTFPRIAHWQITRAVKDRILRAAKDPSSHGTNAEVNRRRRMRDEG